MNKMRFIFYGSLVLTAFACASTQKVDLVSADELNKTVADVVALMGQADSTQSDLLSYSEYNRANNHLEKAQRGLAGNYEQDYILSNAASAKDYFQKALDNTQARSGNATRIMQARKSAIDAGLKDSDGLIREMTKVDEDLRDETDNFAKQLEPKEFSEFQKKYFDLEVKAVQFRKLDGVKNAIQQAASNEADDLAPNSLRTAMFDVNEAQNMIAQSPRDPEIHDESVIKAVDSSVLLSDVMDVILNAPGTPEDIALKVVYQNRELAKLSENVGSLEKDLQSTQSNLKKTEGELQTQKIELETQKKELQVTKSNLSETEGALIMQNKELELASRQVRFQKAMDEAREQFSEEETSVYQQGANLIFRLKKINFASGAAVIPESSKPLLAKVNNIITSLDAESVIVEGHTDAVGSDELNKELSTKRAIAVARYLSSLSGGYALKYRGYGESRPVASNETPEGRAMNRRVDLVVTAKRKLTE